MRSVSPRRRARGGVTALYFAYGSNLWPPRMLQRCPSARVVASMSLEGWALVFDKPSVDGSAKANIREAVGMATPGVVYEIDPSDRPGLDHAEPRYRAIGVVTGDIEAFTYVFRGEPVSLPTYDWYLDLIVGGRAHHGLPIDDLAVPSVPDPRAEMRG